MSYRFEWAAGPAFLGAVLLLLLVPGFALIALAVVALAALAAVVALAGAILAAPYLIVRSVRRHIAERHESMERSLPITTAIARAATALAAEPTTARRSQ